MSKPKKTIEYQIESVISILQTIAKILKTSRMIAPADSGIRVREVNKDKKNKKNRELSE